MTYFNVENIIEKSLVEEKLRKIINYKIWNIIYLLEIASDSDE